MEGNRNGSIDSERRKLSFGIAASLCGATALGPAAEAATATKELGDGAFTWTPRRDQNRDILASSWAELPMNTWVEVTDTSPVPIIARKIVEAGFPFTAPFNSLSSLEGHVRGSFIAWVSGALDAANGRFYVPWGGGHGDGALNGVWRLDLPKMEWHIQKMPSHPQTPGFEWTEPYIRSRSWTQYLDDDGKTWDVANTGGIDALPDGRPTSRHQYEGVVFDPVRNRVMQHRYGRWSIDIDTNTETCERFRDAGLEPGKGATDSRCFFDPRTNDVFAGQIKPYDYWGFYRITPGMRIMRLAPAPRGYHFSAGIAGRIVDRQIMFIGMGSRSKTSYEAHWSVYEIDRDRWRVGTLSDWPEGMEAETMQAMEWIPDVGKLLYWDRRSWRFFWITPDRWTIEPASFAGKTPAPATYAGHKFFYWPARKLVVAALGVVNKAGGSGVVRSNVHVMRTG
jgi:hypothetical protein